MIIFLLVVLAAGINQDCPPPQICSFEDFKKQFHKQYTPDEDPLRRTIFEDNIKNLLATNCCSCGVNKFTASTSEELKALKGLRLPSDFEQLAGKQEESVLQSTGRQIRLKLGAPASLDWRQQGVVTPAKQQGSCGTCWSFATVAMCESSLILQGRAFNNNLYQVNLAEQYLLRCTSGSSCSGGYLESAIDKALQKGLPYESEFPYEPYFYDYGLCSTRDLVKVSNQSRSSKYRVGDSAIVEMLQDGPIAAAVSTQGWQSYKAGVHRCQAGAQIDHAVLIVGYTPEAWIIKNSWGTDFGINGFIYVSRKQGQNCLIGIAVHELSQLTLFLPVTLLLLLLLLVH